MGKIDGYILAGGKSSRMGIDKGRLKLDDKYLIEHVIEKLSPAVRNVILVSNNKEYEQFGKEVIGDIFKGLGPAGGIHAALNHCSTGKIFVTACDMPFISTEDVKFVISKSKNYDITFPEFNTMPQPMFAVFSKHCLPKVTKIIKTGKVTLSELIKNFNFLKLEFANKLFNPDMFTNINTPTDLEKAINIIHDN